MLFCSFYFITRCQFNTVLLCRLHSRKNFFLCFMFWKYFLLYHLNDRRLDFFNTNTLCIAHLNCYCHKHCYNCNN